MTRSRNRDWVPYMQRALELAAQAEANGDVPVGAVVVNSDGRIVSEAFNRRENRKDATAHAELLAIQQLAGSELSWRLSGYTLVVTLEPCVMCAGAAILARLDRVVFGAHDPKAGAMGSWLSLHDRAELNHKVLLEPGVLGDESASVLREFFKKRRG
jgi:tRNA(adenine34) deaminase